jgi:PAS domain S-box-containing protein
VTENAPSRARSRSIPQIDRARVDEIEAALELVNVPSYILDPTGVVRWLNSAARQRVGNINGREFTSVVAPEDRLRSRELFARKVVGGAPVTDAELVLVDPNGNRVAVELSSVPLRSGDQVVGVFGQITEEQEASPLPPPANLTPRQSQVLQMLQRGCSTRQIAGELLLSPETVRNHVRSVLRALGVHTRLEAVAVARRDKLVAE